MVTRFFILLVFTSMMACKPTRQPDTEATAPQVVSNETANEDLPFLVYKNFSDLAYIFQYQNDTTYVINFWATWCKPCVAELPYFEQLHANLAHQPVKVILVSLDFAKDVRTKLVNFVKTRNLQPDVIALTDGKYNDWINKVHSDWSGAIPVTYIYKKGKILFHDQQYDSYQDLATAVQEISTEG